MITIHIIFNVSSLYSICIVLGKDKRMHSNRFNDCKLVIKGRECFMFAPFGLHHNTIQLPQSYAQRFKPARLSRQQFGKGMGASTDSPVYTFALCIPARVHISNASFFPPPPLSLSCFFFSLYCVADEIVSTLGEGTFGRVMRCIDHRRCVTSQSLGVLVVHQGIVVSSATRNKSLSVLVLGCDIRIHQRCLTHFQYMGNMQPVLSRVDQYRYCIKPSVGERNYLSKCLLFMVTATCILGKKQPFLSILP